MKKAVHCVSIIILLATGCATSSSSLRFSQSEVKLIPAVAIHRVLSPSSLNETVMVRASNLPEPAAVNGFEGNEYVVVRDAHGNDAKIAINEISEIDRITQLNRPTSAQKGLGSTAQDVGETLIYAPLIPVAIASWPLLRAMGLDEKRNSKDREKALLLYGGMTKQTLRESIGEPKERYLCQDKNSGDILELWRYEKDKVLRGGRFLFLSPEEGKVIFASFRFPNWENCSPLRE